MGFTLATHYCGGHAVETALIIGDSFAGCGMEEMTQPLNEASKTPELKRIDCCENEYLSLNIEDDFQQSSTEKKVDLKFVFTFVYTYFQLDFSERTNDVIYSDYSPPPSRQDIQVLFQTFLI